ncbi:hypothetical protein ER308_05975 [Egibacter rhizosphaerae]|uniref:Cell wall-binding repeat-containing protein n=1 Tax=Egibacter rhizosphaerae TaxID=1670831 RepID=A0A411YD53_9ACTN|nr:cell wall-binding repeat-containing protein [Egibacter rhizosphaerae]QBI19130.1 hypothetical protein ER308_05975 [Egibacter rhizosphaerae]
MDPTPPRRIAPAGPLTAIALLALALVLLDVANVRADEHDEDETPAPEVGETLEIERLGGDDRFATAILAAERAHPDGSEQAVMATGRDFADALVATVRSASLDAPLLLLPDRLRDDDRDALDGLGIERAVVAGGVTPVPYITEVDLARADVELTRVAGVTRYDTAARLATEDATAGEGGAQVVIASGEDFADAVTGSAIAAADQTPLLLTRRDALPDDTAAAIDRLGPDGTVVVGGTAAVADGVMDQLPDARRVAGDDRVATSVAAARERLDEGTDPSEVVVASGRSFPDALSAGALAASADAPLLLVEPAADPGGAAVEFVREHAAAIERLVVVGGPSAVPEQALGALEEAAGDGAAAEARHDETDANGQTDGDAEGDEESGNTEDTGNAEHEEGDEESGNTGDTGDTGEREPGAEEQADE